MFDLIAFDGDDTLWHNESLYAMGRERFRGLIARYRHVDKLEESIDRVEIRNLSYYGYGAMSFVLSLIETAIELTGGEISGDDIKLLLDLGKEMLAAEVVLFEGVVDTLAHLSRQKILMLITKGDLQHQQNKLMRSGIREYFQHVEIVSDKTPHVYTSILDRVGVPAERFLMIGNSLRSDILPVLELGGWAVYVPHDLTWSHESVTPPDGPLERLYEIATINQLPELLTRLENLPPG